VITFTLPYPPSSNVYWRAWRNRVVLSPEARAYKSAVAQRFRRMRAQRLRGSVGVRIHVYRPQKSGDLDNRFKVALDALNKVAWEDDDQIVELHSYRKEDPANPRVEVAVWTVAPAHVQEKML
jgi:crossover junction endodeoxyribonuclease RusA